MCLATKAILFLGTPHRGSQHADMGENLRRIASAAGFDTAPQNISTLQIDNGTLTECHRRFQQLQRRQGIEICTFQEDRGMTGIPYLGLNQKVHEYDVDLLRKKTLNKLVYTLGRIEFFFVIQ